MLSTESVGDANHDEGKEGAREKIREKCGLGHDLGEYLKEKKRQRVTVQECVLHENKTEALLYKEESTREHPR